MRLNDDSTPARYNPCQEVHFVTNLASAPAGAQQDVIGAMTRLANATGITFVFDGETTERPSRARPLYDKARYGDRWVPILIAWVRPGETDQNLSGGILGLGGSTAVKEQGRWVYVTGQVTLNADYNSSFGGGFGTGYTWGEVLIHEVTHVLGLHHADDIREIMYPTATANAAELGPGDRSGLYNLGRPAGCLSQPDPWWLRTAGVSAASAGAPGPNDGLVATAAAPPETSSDEAQGGIWAPTPASSGSSVLSASATFPTASSASLACEV
jgi:Matrixin